MSTEGTTKFYGKYRGTVSNNIDPLKMGRIQVTVPDVLGSTPSSWAMPCVPIAGLQSGVYVVPPVQAGVWVEFEQGDPDFPIWTGGWWGSTSEIPALALAGPPALQTIVFQTTQQTTLLISDVPGPTGGLLLKNSKGAMIMVNDVGITITNGKGASITMIGNTITMNEGALTIM